MQYDMKKLYISILKHKAPIRSCTRHTSGFYVIKAYVKTIYVEKLKRYYIFRLPTSKK